MQPDFDTHETLDVALNHRFRGHAERDWNEWAERHHVECASDIPDTASRTWLNRQKLNYKGVSDRKALEHVIAANVDQPFLEELTDLGNLRRLELEWPFVATDLSPLKRLSKLKHLSIDTPRKIADFSVLSAMPLLRTVLITNAAKMSDLEWLRGAHHLEVIGVEGAIDKTFDLPSLAPLAGLASLTAFFGVSTRLPDQSLASLANCPNLRYLKIARVVPLHAFQELKRACPDLFCTWFDPGAWGEHGLRPL